MRNYTNVNTIRNTIARVNKDDDYTSSEDRVMSMTNGIVTFYYPWDTSYRNDDGDEVPTGYIISPEAWNADVNPRKRPDFIIEYVDEGRAEDPFMAMAIECKRPGERIFSAIDQLCNSVKFATSFPDNDGKYGGFIIVVVGKEIAFFVTPFFRDANRTITWKELDFNIPGLNEDFTLAKTIYRDARTKQEIVGYAWHIHDQSEVCNRYFLRIKQLTEERVL